MTSQHLDDLVRRVRGLEVCRPDIERAFETLREAFRSHHKVLICGNGGSAADAEHWAGELLKGFRHKRPLSVEDRAKLPERLAASLQGALPAIPLTGFPSLATAFGNDVDPELSFAQLVWGLGQPGDVLIGISTSGNATNVCAALQAARSRGLRTLGLAGETSGAMKDLCDVIILAPARETYLIQEYHLAIYHSLSMALEDEFF
jgi:D-sedoheptulose 7-phosphate isomerase